ncbi:MAG: S24/S26 family peptidase [Actinomycetota bacterium]
MPLGLCRLPAGPRRGGAARALAALLVVGGLLLVAFCRPARLRVRGPSMAPALADGDGLLVCRGWLAARARPGEVVVVARPGGGEAVKRLVGRSGAVVDAAGGPLRLAPGEIAVAGDDPARSTDSRRWGPLPAGALRGRALGVYDPPERVRWGPTLR